ncbi:MAG: hypothetical protein IH933_11985 [Euryarchaeota archaeon]|nr:hypothetical protein [Euryarchaeota archaeon]
MLWSGEEFWLARFVFQRALALLYCSPFSFPPASSDRLRAKRTPTVDLALC